ncbi:hypothetical protein EVAR_54874_1 [Eumeta japonica]|uniref:Uncharacterized protein n=1 Tax=Eumeta variegata TaxID=151549 RepID=A0A4C1YG99_EUMVA|nr:hypothetical protein EVAR_54874_1 [Eumeta japonica]
MWTKTEWYKFRSALAVPRRAAPPASTPHRRSQLERLTSRFLLKKFDGIKRAALMRPFGKPHHLIAYLTPAGVGVPATLRRCPPRTHLETPELQTNKSF